MLNYIESQFSEHRKVNDLLSQNDQYKNVLRDMGNVLTNAFENGHKLLLFGNGGSASDAQHIAAEFVGRFKMERQGLGAIALPCNASNITAIGNDYGFETIFSRQVEALAKDGDILMGFSTSGNSANVVKALEYGKKKNLKTLGFTGSQEGKMDEFCDFLLRIPSKNTARIQEKHILCGHILCGLVDLFYLQKE